MLTWIKINKGFAKTKCETYQMSMCYTEKHGNMYTVFYVSGVKNNPYENLGYYKTAQLARDICQAHFESMDKKEIKNAI